MKLKENYRNILFQLERDSRKSLTEIGRSIEKSQQTTSYAVNNMEERDQIKGYYPLFDYTKFGYNGYLLLFRINNFSREKIDDLVKMFLENEMVAWVQMLDGVWDILLFFLAPNPSYFNKEFKSVVSEYPEQLSTYEILTSVVIHDMERAYLSEESSMGTRDIIIGGDRNVFSLKDEERETCRVINENPRKATVSMAEELGVTSKTVMDRRKSLEERKLIKGYRPLLGIRELDLFVTIVLISYKEEEVEKENEVVDYCRAHENVALLMKTFGSWDMMIRLETESREGKRKVVRSLRENFGKVISDYNSLEVMEDLKKSYLPDGFFKPDAFQPVEE
ncbi:MAG: winged helix-turn-helix transcriptional regulator [Candidatus Nanohaloarchaea archaeon]